MESVVLVNPFRCCMWALHDRMEDQITEESCRKEIESFESHGQLVPALGRPRRGDPDHDVELIYGARRLFVARHLNKPLAVQLRELSDREAIVAMDIENRHRRDISPYERGMSYLRLLRGKHLKSQDDLARALNVSPSQVSRLLKLARLPSVIVNAFPSSNEIHEGWGLDLMEAWETPEKQPLMAKRARAFALQSPRQPAAQVYRELLTASVPGRRIRKGVHDQVVTGSNGAPLFRIRHQHKSICVVLPVDRVSARCLEEIRTAIGTIIQAQTRQRGNSAEKRAVATDEQLPA